MTKYTPEEIKNRLSNIGEAIGTIALEYIVKIEKENQQLKQKWLESEYEKSKLVSQIEKMKCCQNCKLRGAECVALEYQGILCGKTRDKWELDK